jgi:hypothetical protein
MHTTKEYSKCFQYNKIISVSSPPPGKQEELSDLINDVDLDYIPDDIPNNSCCTELLQYIPIKDHRVR